MKRGIFINVHTRTIEWVEVGNYKDIQKVLGCEMFGCTEVDDNNTIYSDDNGLRNCKNFFRLKGGYYDDPIPRNGLILGDDHETGESTDCTLSLEYVKERIEFLSDIDVILMYRFRGD